MLHEIKVISKKNYMEDNKKLLEIVKSKIYHGEMKKGEFLEAIKEAEEDILRDIQSSCEHTYIYRTSGNGYGFEDCSKCGKLKT